MRLQDFEYTVPTELIAQQPIEPRDHSRLFYYERRQDSSDHDVFCNIDQYLGSGDVLVFNNTKVFPARLLGKKVTGGEVEVFLLRDFGGGMWQVMLDGARRTIGTEITIAPGFSCEVVSRGIGSVWMVQFSVSSERLWELIYAYGTVPLPPYIQKATTLNAYQTSYAQHVGSVAAPTAGFHFTPALIQKLQANGVGIEYVTLHVGLGTFAPVYEEDITQHHIHAEWSAIDEVTATRLNHAKQANKRIIAVGTTSVRTLEHFTDRDDLLHAGHDWTSLFIYPGYEFKFIDGMITNFHVPRSSLMMLVAAFLTDQADPQSGIKKLQELYQQAIEMQYRFYSYGDAMLLV